VTPIVELQAEHEVILRVLDAIRRENQHLRRKGELRIHNVTRILDFIRVFADRNHHAKEEHLLFERMKERGLPGHTGPIAVMLHEHQSGRSLVAAASRSLQDAQAGQADASRTVAECLEAYATLLQQHIAKENDVLYPWAERILSPDDMAWLEEQFKTVNAQVLSAEDRAAYTKLATELA
jgi:hemerythrin-like domain-containing protein